MISVQRQKFDSFNALWVFNIAAEYKSFKKAAEVLCVTPSAVSQQIKNLEANLSILLFERQHQSLKLTEAGQWYWQKIQPQLSLIQDHTVQLMQRYNRTVLKISCMPPVASRVIFPHLRTFQQAWPEIELRFDVSLKYIDLQHNNTADIAIRFGRPPWSGCEHQKLVDLDIQPVCAPKIASQLNLKSHPERLTQAPLIHMTSRPEAWTLVFDYLGLSLPDKNESIYVDDYPAAIDAAYNLGVALALYPIENTAIKNEQLVAVGPAISGYGEIYAVTKQGRLQEQAIQTFLAWLIQRLQDLN
ncbi:MAG: LysR family transcriptional regulator [Acinetobacter sp.]|nr:LysR family transcriptional regulator [Acinetobacter sp.]